MSTKVTILLYWTQKNLWNEKSESELRNKYLLITKGIFSECLKFLELSKIKNQKGLLRSTVSAFKSLTQELENISTTFYNHSSNDANPTSPTFTTLGSLTLNKDNITTSFNISWLIFNVSIDEIVNITTTSEDLPDKIP